MSSSCGAGRRSFALAADPGWPLEPGDRVAYRFRWHGIPLPWISEIVTWETDRELTYRQARGPYRSFVHHHDFVEASEGARVTDRIDYDVPGGRLAAALVQRDLVRLFAERRTRLRAWAREGFLQEIA